MFVVCNGAFKSGSTWLFSLVRGMIKCEPIPAEFHSEKKWKGHNISPKKLPRFLEEMDYSNKNYVCKSHYDDVKIRDLLLSYENVYTLNIKRDIRDVIVSAYYHYNREDGVNRTFEEFYRLKGRSLISFLEEYHKTWHSIKGKIHVSSYEKLLKNFDREVAAISRFLNRKVKSETLERLRNRTNLNAMRNRRNEQSRPEAERFFRKGIIGDWKNHFTPEIAEDVIKRSQPGFYRSLNLALHSLKRILPFKLKT